MKKITLIPVLLGFILIPSAFAFAAPTQDLTVGSRGADVLWLQEQLISAHTGTAASALASAGATGYFGPLTRAALAEYQSSHSITPAAGYFGPKTRAAMTTTTDASATTFTGTISAVNVGCFVDGICSVTVGGKEVIIATGMRADQKEVGTLKGVDSIGDLEKEMGKTARVFAAPTTEGGAEYTLYGSTSYYVELAPAVPANGPITIKGETECLPPKNPNGLTIMLCAMGLKGEDGHHYALRDTDESYANVSGVSGKVEVRGTFTRGEDTTWNRVGVIEVTRITEDN